MISFLGSIPGLDGGPSYLGALDWLQPVVTMKARPTPSAENSELGGWERTERRFQAQLAFEMRGEGVRAAEQWGAQS